jgi:hypothetical protein
MTRALAVLVLPCIACAVPEYRYASTGDVGDGAVQERGCEAAFCENFEGRTEPLGAWTDQLVSAPFAVSLVNAGDPHASVLQAKLVTQNPYNVLGHGLLRKRFAIAPRRVRMTFALRRTETWHLDDRQNPIALAYIGLGDGKYVSLCHMPFANPSGGGWVPAEKSSIAIAGPGSGAPCSPCHGAGAGCVPGFTLLRSGDWQRVAIQLEEQAGVYKISCCDELGVPETLPATLPSTPSDTVSIALGMSAIGINDPPDTMQYDDLVVELDPR